MAGFDAFLAAAQNCLHARERIEESCLREHTAHTQKFRRHLEANFQQSAPSRPKTALYLETRGSLKEYFEAFRRGMREVEKFLAGRSSKHLEDGCRQAAHALAGLQRLASQLGQEESGFPRPESAMDEILILLDFFERGTLDPKVVTKRSDEFRSRCRTFREDIAMWSAGKSPKDELVALMARACKNLLEAERGLGDLILHVKGERLRDLPELRQQLRSYGETLQTDYREVEHVLNPQLVCPKCSHANQMGEKLCRACGAILPATLGNGSSTWSTVEEEQQAQKPRFTYLVQVENAIESFLAGQSELADLQGVVDWFAPRVQSGYERYKQLPTPLEPGDPKEREMADAIRNGFEKGSASLLNCARDLQRFLVSSERELLSRALEALHEGEELMMESHGKLNGRP